MIEELREEPGSPAEITKRLDTKHPERGPWSRRTLGAGLKRGLAWGIFKELQGGKYAFVSYQGTLSLESFVDSLRRDLLRDPTIEEIGEKAGLAPNSSDFRDAIYQTAGKIRWHEPTPEQIKTIERLKAGPDPWWQDLQSISLADAWWIESLKLGRTDRIRVLAHYILSDHNTHWKEYFSEDEVRRGENYAKALLWLAVLEARKASRLIRLARKDGSFIVSLLSQGRLVMSYLERPDGVLVLTAGGHDYELIPPRRVS